MEYENFFKCPFCAKLLSRIKGNLMYNHQCYVDHVFSVLNKNKIEMEEEETILQNQKQPKEEMVAFNIENEDNTYFLKHGMNLIFDLKHMKLIKNFYLMCPEEMPKFYSINRMALSMNSLQQDRYLEETFIYYNTIYRDKIRNQIDEILSSDLILKIQLKGLMGSGKSYFLSDYVLRKRVQRQNGKFRIMYINNSEEFLRGPLSYIFNELKYMIWLDFENDDGLDFKQWFAILNKNQSSTNTENYLNFLIELKEYYNSKKIKVILIWDQINVIYRVENKTEPEFSLYKTMTDSYTYFNNIILSSSNNNQEINIEVQKTISIEMNPFEIFKKNEFKTLIEAEASIFNLVPSDVKIEDISNYLSELSNILNFSISEYYFYKYAAWNRKLHCSTINFRDLKTNLSNYYDDRDYSICESELNFRKEYLKNVNLYYLSLKKIEVSNNKIHFFEENTNCYNYENPPTVYNKQLLFLIEKDNVLVCTSLLVRDTILNLKLDSSLYLLNPWDKLENRKNGNMFQFQVQSHYLNNKFSLNFGDKIQITIFKKIYFYDCLNTLQELLNCNALGSSILCHFLQQNHFAFDSMLYDGKTQTLVMIQITIDEKHRIPYQKLEKIIKNEPVQLEIGEKKDRFKKYIVFFQELERMKFVKKYVYQWMTDKIYDDLVRNSDKEKEKLEDPNFMEIFPYDKNLITEINKL